jgi:peptidyl-prolyl cis-trans isomerase D
LADSIGAIVKATPAKFTEFLKLSNDPNSAAQEVAWLDYSRNTFVPEFLTYLANNPKGATGVVETQFGYHIINIEDKNQDQWGIRWQIL